MAPARALFARSHRDNALTRRWVTAAAVAAAVSALVWWIDAVLAHRTANGTDHALRLSAILVYVGVDGSYMLARALGIAALVTAYGAVLLGLLPGRGPGSSLRGELHRQLGAVTAVLVAGHAVVPYTSGLGPYGGWATNFVPWGQPVSWGLRAASWESMGILAFYLLLLTGPTYYLLRRRSAVWSAVHRLSFVVYALAVVHVLLLGTDFLVAGLPRWILLGAQVPVLALLACRLTPRPGCGRRGLRRTGSVAAGAAALGAVALTALSATGGYAGGMRL